MSIAGDSDYMAAWARAESTGRWPDQVHFPTGEDRDDPDSHEIDAMVHEQYAMENYARRERELRHENDALRAELERNGVDVDAMLYGGE